MKLDHLRKIEDSTLEIVVAIDFVFEFTLVRWLILRFDFVVVGMFYD